MAAVDGDIVYPTSFIDNNTSLRTMILSPTLLFNDVLDGDKLNDALCRLMEIGDWAKLGGRLRKGKGRTFEIHVPKKFTKQRPAVRYHNKTFDMSIHDHPVAKNFPAPTHNASLQPIFSDFPSITTEPDPVTCIEDLLKKDIPLNSLYVVTFNDATVVTILWPHALVDAGSLETILRNWSLVLAGKEDQVKPLLGTREDFIYNLAHSKVDDKEELVTRKWFLTGFGLFLFVMRFLWSVLTKPLVARTLFLPKHQLAQMVAQARDDIATEYAGQEPLPWVSEGDVLNAWGIQVTAQAQPSPRPINVITMVDLRRRLPEIMTSGGEFVQNVIQAAYIRVSAKMSRQPLGLLALKCRQDLLQQVTPTQSIKYLEALRESYDAGREASPAPLKPFDADLLVFTNWTRMDMMRMTDFSPAVIKEGGVGAGPRHNPPGTMVVLLPGSRGPTKYIRDIMGTTGKDCAGNYWMTLHLNRNVMAVLEQQIAKWSESKGVAG